ncbi:hypothetical protein WISP_65859 [Willisornis vidua]|uniref:Reverse transcriptase domain-containing protein n=1 Tax=Willisornis vidua TaxID=1566151 RepID=A0ABQ9DF05_9PASS|nr:hypothetical protein WISP_65859 [Willisornis vidua]
MQSLGGSMLPPPVPGSISHFNFTYDIRRIIASIAKSSENLHLISSDFPQTDVKGELAEQHCRPGHQQEDQVQQSRFSLSEMDQEYPKLDRVRKTGRGSVGAVVLPVVNGLDGTHLGVLRKLVELLTGTLSIIYHWSWLNGEVPYNWSLISFYDQLTHLVYVQKVVDVVHLDFSKAFDTVSHRILLKKLAAHGLGVCCVHWVQNWLKGQAQRAMVNGIKSIWQLVTRAQYWGQSCSIPVSMVWMTRLSAPSVHCAIKMKDAKRGLGLRTVVLSIMRFLPELNVVEIIRMENLKKRITFVLCLALKEKQEDSETKISQAMPEEVDNWPLELIDKDRKLNNPPNFQEDTVSDLMKHLDPQKSMGPDGIHARVMRELMEELVKSPSTNSPGSVGRSQIIGSCQMSPQSTKRAARPGNYRPVSLTLVPGKDMEQIILSAITQHLQDGQGLRPSQHGFRKGTSCLTNLISFYDQVMTGG